MSGTDFLIKIAQQVTGDNPVTELQKSEAAVTGAMKKYAELERASLAASKSLERAGASAADAGVKMQKAVAAGDTAGIAKLAPALEKAVAKERELAAAAQKTKSALDAEAAGVTALANNLTKLKSAEAAAVTQQRAMADSARDAAKALADTEKARLASLEATAKTGDGLNKLGGPLGRLGNQAKEFTEGWRDLTSKMGTGRAAMLVGAVAVAALAAALIAGGMALAKFVIGLANTRRDTGLTIEALYGAGDAASSIQGSFLGITRSTGIAGERLMAITRDLKAAGVAAGDVPAALKAIAQQESALGDSSGTAKLIESLKDGTKSVSQLGAEMGKQFGDIAAKKAAGLDQQMEILRANIADLFTGANIEGFLRGLQSVVAIFDASTVSGQALKTLFESLGGPLGGVEGIFAGIRRFILGAILAALQLAIAIKKTAKALGFDTSSLSGLVDAADVGAAAFYLLATPIMLVAAGIAAVVVGAKLLASTWGLLSTLGTAFVDGFVGGIKLLVTGVTSAATGVYDAITGLVTGAIAVLNGAWAKFTSVGTSLISGLVAGIKAGATAVLNAITGVVQGGIDAAVKLLDIGSPSKVFHEIGGFTAEGFAQGIDDGAPEAERSMADMVEAPTVKAAKPGKSGGPGITIQAGAFVFHISGDNAEENARLVEEKIEQFFAGMSAQAGVSR